MRKEFIQGFISGICVITLLVGISFLIHPKENKTKTFTHLQISKEPLKKGIAEVFYPTGNVGQEKLSTRILEILTQEYELIEKVLGIPPDKILAYQTYGLVFCEDIDDEFLKYTNQGLVSIDGVLCYPVVNEVGFPFRDAKTRLRLVYNLPKEVVKGILKERLNLEDDALWFAEGVGGYIGFLCWQKFDTYAFFNYEYPRVLNLNPTQEILDLTNYESFKEFSCYASIFIIIDLIKHYGQSIIVKIISKLEKDKQKIGSEEITQSIKELTGQDIQSGLKSVAVERVEERFKLLKAKFGFR